MPRHTRYLQRAFGGGELSVEMFSRVEDAKFQHGAAKISNLICAPQGPAVKRPGFRFVDTSKDSTAKSRLLPFVFSVDQSLVIAAGRTVVDSRSIGYFRFFTQGAPLLYSLPRDYAAPLSVSSIASNEITFGVTHKFQTGDPVGFTISPSTSITFSTGTPGKCNLASASTVLAHGTPVIFAPDIGGTLPTEITAYRVYYAANPSGTDFEIALTRFGPSIAILSGTGSGTRLMASIPTLGSLDPKQRRYAIFVSSTKIKIAASKADAVAGTAIPITHNGNGDRKVHYDYRPGDLVNDTGLAVMFYCMKEPWGEPNAPLLEPVDHTGHPPPHPYYWYRVPGTTAAVTLNDTTDRVNWTAHGLANGDPVLFSGTTPPSIPTDFFGAVFFVRNKTTNDFQVSRTPSGPIENLGTGSSGVVAFANSFFEVPHFYEQADLFDINFVQSGDVLTLVHPTKPAAELRRLGATQWTFDDIKFNSAVAPPTGLGATTFRGHGWNVTSVTIGANPVITLASNHSFVSHVSHIEIAGVLGTGGFSLPDGFYVVNTIPAANQITVKVLETGALITTVGTNTPNTGAVRPVSPSSRLQEVYVVTAVDVNGEESAASTELTVTNNLLIEGAYTTLSWSAVSGATRYHVYKKQNGLFGIIGETDALTFKDDNIGPDLSITPPILDLALRKRAIVTFNTSTDYVQWTAHGLTAGAPVMFESNDTLPGVSPWTTYYVINPDPDQFQVSTTQGGAAVNLTGPNIGTHYARSGAFPGAVTYVEQRRAFAGALQLPQDTWATASGTEADLSYSIPTVDSDRIYFRVAAREAGRVRHLVPLSHLMLLTNYGELRVTPINDDALTPTSVSVRPQSYVGAGPSQPAVVNNTAVFVAARGGHVRELSYSDTIAGYFTGDLSVRAEHLFDDFTITQHAYQKAPLSCIWFVSSSGKLLALTYLPEEQVGAWHQHETDGTFESVAVVPEGDEDRVYAIVLRTLNGVSTRTIEQMATFHTSGVVTLEDAFHVDCGLSYSGAAVTVLTGLDHLNGETVSILADGLVQATQVVANGQITLAVAASDIQVGLPFTAELQTLPASMQVDAVGTGRTKNVSNIWLRVAESGAFRAGPSVSTALPSFNPPSGELLTGMVQVALPGTWSDDGQITVLQSDPLPLMVVGLTYELAMGG